MLNADLDPTINKWHAIYDFNDPSKTQENWRHLLPEEQDPMWSPLGRAESMIRQTLVSRNEEDNEDNYNFNDSGTERSGPEQSPPEESGIFHSIKVFGWHSWAVISQTICSIHVFCLGLIFSGMKPSNQMLSP